MNQQHTFRVTCDCEVCKVNAERVGQPFPLAAKNLGVTERNANKASKVHGFVYAAHDPSTKGLPVERRFSIPA